MQRGDRPPCQVEPRRWAEGPRARRVAVLPRTTCCPRCHSYDPTISLVLPEGARDSISATYPRITEGFHCILEKVRFGLHELVGMWAVGIGKVVPFRRRSDLANAVVPYSRRRLVIGRTAADNPRSHGNQYLEPRTTERFCCILSSPLLDAPSVNRDITGFNTSNGLFPASKSPMSCRSPA